MPALDTFLDALPVAADCLFIHDVAVLPQARGRGAAASFILHADAVTMQHNLPAQALIAAYGSVRLWQRFGFAPLQGDHSVAKLAAYGAGAVYMSRAAANPPRWAEHAATASFAPLIATGARLERATGGRGGVQAL